MMIVACAITVPLELENWTMVLATDGHILSIVGALYLGMIGGLNLPMILIFMSTVVWVVGILFAAELGIVAWLSLENQEDLSKD